MRFFSVFALVLVVAAVKADDKRYHKLKKWAFHKAMEGCFGKEAVRQYLIKYKTIASKCLQQDAPELDLPMFKYPYRTVDALLDGAYGPQKQMMHDYNQGHRNKVMAAHRPQSAQGQQDDDDMLDSVLRKVFLKKMLAKMIEDEYLGEGRDDVADDDEDDGMGPAVLGPMRFFTRRGHGHSTRNNGFLKIKIIDSQRHKRQAPSSLIDNPDRKEMFELGDRLTAKLQEAKRRYEAKVGNYTCMMRECGVIDEEDNLVPVDNLIKEMRKFTINGDDGDGWLRSEIEDNIRICHKYAESIPEEVLEECAYGPKLAKVKKYKKCLKMAKAQTCMNYDIKQQLEENFGGSLDDLVQSTQLEERELLPLVMELLHGPEVQGH